MTAGFDEQLIKVQTGHQSDAVHAYKRPTKSHALQVSEILQPSMPQAKQTKLEEQHSVVPVEVSNSQQYAVMHSNVIHFRNAAGSSTFVFNFGK